MVPGIRRNPLHNSPKATTGGGIPLLQRSNSHESRDSMKRRLVTLEEQGPRYRQEIGWLQQQVQLLTLRANQMKAERNNAEYNTQIWKRRVGEQQDKLDERDKAIAKLTDQTIQNEGKTVQELKNHHRQEIKETVRWHESILKTKSDKIVQLERQVTQLKAYNSQFSSAQSSQVSNMMAEVDRLRNELQGKDEEIALLRRKVGELERAGRETEALERQAKIKSLIGDNEALAIRLREVKRQLWKARDSSGEVEELKQDLADARKQIKSLETERGHTMEKARREIEETVRSELQAAQQTHRLLEERLVQMEAMQKSSPRPSTSSMASADGKEIVSQLMTKVQNLTNRNMLRISKTKTEALEVESRGNENGCSDSDSDSSSCPSRDAPDKSGDKPTTAQFPNADSSDRVCASDESLEDIASTQSAAERLESFQSSSDKAQKKIRQLELELEASKSKEEALKNQLEDTRKEQSVQGVLVQAQKAREASEQSIVRTFERRITDMSSEKDARIDELYKDLIAIRTKRADEVTELNRELLSLRSELASIHKDYNEQLKQKDQHIYALEHTLHAQEQTMDNMRSEMDQLQRGMEAAASNRKGDVEALEQEVMLLRAGISKQEKQVTNLRIHLKEEELGHKAEILRLEELVAELETQLPKKAKVLASIENNKRVHMVKGRLDQLKLRNNELKDENKQLGERLEKASIENNQRIHMVKGRLDELKLRNNELKEENIQLGERLEKAIVKIHSLEDKSKTAADIKIECDILRRQVTELQRVVEQKQPATGLTSFLEIEKPDSPDEEVTTNNAASFLERRSQRRKSQAPLRPRKSSLTRLFKRKKSSTASNAALVPDSKQTRKTLSVGRAGRKESANSSNPALVPDLEQAIPLRKTVSLGRAGKEKSASASNTELEPDLTQTVPLRKSVSLGLTGGKNLSVASNAVLVPDLEQAIPLRKTVSLDRTGRTMYMW